MTPYTGGPYITLDKDSDCPCKILSNCTAFDEPIDINYGRVNDGINEVIERLVTNFAPWEWWFDYSGRIYIGQQRGTDKSTNIVIVAGDRLNKVSAERTTKESAQRIRVTGQGESKGQDDITSDWYIDATAMAEINGFYEKLKGIRDITRKEIADIVAQTLLTMLKDKREELTITDFDNSPYTADDYDLGDEITVTDAATALSGIYRVATIEKTIDERGEQVILTLNKRRTDITDRLASLQKELDRLQYGNTVLDRFLAAGGLQGSLDPKKMETIWDITSSNKTLYTAPEESTEAAPDQFMTWNEAPGGIGTYSCDKDYFELTMTAVGAEYLAYEIDHVDWDQNPRFTCELEIDHAEGPSDTWANGDSIEVVMEDIGFTRFFGFRIRYSTADGGFVAEARCQTTAGALQTLRLDPTFEGQIDYDTKIKLEARVEWEEQVIRFFAGTGSYDFQEIAILPISSGTTGASGTLCPMVVRMTCNVIPLAQTMVGIFHWKSQALKEGLT